MNIKKVTTAAAALFAAASICAVPACADTESYSTITKGLTMQVNGDVNGDGKVDISDVVQIAAQVKGKTSIKGENAYLADTNGDYTVNVSDVSLAAAQVKGKSPMGDVKCGRAVREARKFLHSGVFHIRLSQPEEGKNTSVMDVSMNGNDFKTLMTGYISDSVWNEYEYVASGSSFYEINHVSKEYMVSNATKNAAQSQSNIVSLTLGEKYTYIGQKAAEGGMAEVYKNTSGSSTSYFAYISEGGVLKKVIKYTDDEAPSTVIIDTISGEAEITVPDLTGYTKRE